MTARTAYYAAAALTLLLAVGSADAQTGAAQPWPSSLTKVSTQEELRSTDYTAEERRNIMTVLTEMSDEARAAWLREPNRAPHEGFPGLDKYYGARGYDQATSIPDRKDRILDIIAKDNRVFGVFTITGHHQGMMWGWRGDGKPLEILQFFYRTFDDQGRTTENIFRGEELQLYVALGGKVAFPQDGIAAQKASSPLVGQAPAVPARGRAPQEPFWTMWPPAEWPSGVRSEKLKKWLMEANWTEQERHNIQRAIEDQFIPPDFNNPVDLSIDPFCGISCPTRRRGFDYLDYLSGFHGYNAARSSRDRFNETDDIIAKGNRVVRTFVGRGTMTGYWYGFHGDGRALEWREIGTGNSGAGLRAEELQLYVAIGGKLQFPGKDPVP